MEATQRSQKPKWMVDLEEDNPKKPVNIDTQMVKELFEAISAFRPHKNPIEYSILR